MRVARQTGCDRLVDFCVRFVSLCVRSWRMELFFFLRSVHKRIFLCDGGVEMVVVVERLMFGCGKRGRLLPTQPLQTRNMHTSAPAGSLSWTTLSVWHLARAPRQPSTTSEAAVVSCLAIPGLRISPQWWCWTGQLSSIYALKNWLSQRHGRENIHIGRQGEGRKLS